MKFYVISGPLSEVAGCETSLHVAKAAAKDLGAGAVVDLVEVDVNRETMRRLLGELGGYANRSQRVGEVVGKRFKPAKVVP